jgi:hypothetical protein
VVLHPDKIRIVWKGLPGSNTGEGKTTYTFSVSMNAFSVEFPLACYQQAVRVWYVSGALRRTYTLFYPTPSNTLAYFTNLPITNAKRSGQISPFAPGLCLQKRSSVLLALPIKICHAQHGRLFCEA